jgi:hypothetical protein
MESIDWRIDEKSGQSGTETSSLAICPTGSHENILTTLEPHVLVGKMRIALVMTLSLIRRSR